MPTGAARVLLVDDDAAVHQVLRDGLNAREFELHRASTLAEARRMLNQTAWDLFVLDIRLPDGSGLSLAREMRQAGSTLPILMLTVASGLEDRVEGLDLGADDYLGKPFAVEELAARLHALLRRSRGSHPHVLRFLDIELDLVKRVLRRGKLSAELSSREAELMAYLMRHPREVLDRRRIVADVWNDPTEEGSNVLNVYINYLRNKVEGGLYPRVIHTLRGVGYVLSDRAPDGTE